MLEDTDLKVIEIANAVGYENQGKFARVFAKKYGVAPLEYRRIKRGNLYRCTQRIKMMRVAY